MNPLPPSSKTMLQILGKEGALTHKDLQRLKENQLIIEKANMQDMRQIIYQDIRVPVRKNWLTEFGLRCMNIPDREKGTS